MLDSDPASSKIREGTKVVDLKMMSQPRYTDGNDSATAMNWWVYILRCGDGSLYTGITNNLEQRFKAHESGNGAKYTKGRAPLRLVYREECLNRSMALRREFEIKKLRHVDKLVLAGAKAAAG